MYVATSAIGGLMHEHQLILRVVRDMPREVERISAAGSVDADYVFTVVDFIRTYADKCHHGKEEDILFRELAAKELSEADAAAMQRLIEDHVWGRRTTAALVEATRRYASGDTHVASEVSRYLKELAELYPGHIEREDHDFFRKASQYFSREELDAMAAECADFERSLIHEKYAQVAEEIELRRG